jgi:hypothetical protein
LNYCTCKGFVLYHPLLFHLCRREIQCRVKKFLFWNPILWSTARWRGVGWRIMLLVIVWRWDSLIGRCARGSGSSSSSGCRWSCCLTTQ